MVVEHQSYIEGGYYSTPPHPVVPPTGAGAAYYAAAHHQSSHGPAGYPHPQAHYDYNHGSQYYGVVHHGVAYTGGHGCPFTAKRAGYWVRKGC